MPPLDFGFPWRDRGERRRYGKVMTLFTPAQLSPADGYSAAWKALRPELDAIGFSWTSLIGEEGIQPCFWELPKVPAFDAAALQERVTAAIEAEAERQAKRAASMIAAWEREVATNAEAAGPIRAALAVVVDEHPWQLGRRLVEARQLLEVDDWGTANVRLAGRLLGNAEGNAARALVLLSRPWLPAWYVRAESPDVRVAAHAACQFLSDLDTDWAAIQNSEGWSQATCWTGHTLAEMESLDQAQAAHALALLHGHRLQLSDQLAERCFGQAPVRKLTCRQREAAAAPGGLLA